MRRAALTELGSTMRLNPFQYRSEVEISGSVATADWAERSAWRANSAGVVHPRAEWGRASL